MVWSVRAGRLHGPSITYKNKPCWVTLLQSARRAAVLDQPSSLRPHWIGPRIDSRPLTLSLFCYSTTMKEILRAQVRSQWDAAQIIKKWKKHNIQNKSKKCIEGRSSVLLPIPFKGNRARERFDFCWPTWVRSGHKWGSRQAITFSEAPSSSNNMDPTLLYQVIGVYLVKILLLLIGQGRRTCFQLAGGFLVVFDQLTNLTPLGISKTPAASQSTFLVCQLYSTLD